MYPEKAGNTADMIAKVEKQKEKERDKLSMLEGMTGISVDEYDNWDPTKEPGPSGLGKRRRSAVDDEEDEKGQPKADEREEVEGAEGQPRRPRRQAAVSANSYIAGLMDQVSGPNKIELNLI